MDKLGFEVRDSQNTQVLIPIKFSQKNKVIMGKQEWITAIKCINASEDVLSLLVIFKDKHMNTDWLPPETPSD
jgi:hypothetical protein